MEKETIERDFGMAKEHHSMRYTQLVGKEKMSMKVGLTFACMDMKKPVNLLAGRDEQAVSVAAYNRIDNSVLFSAGKAAMKMGIMPENVTVCFGIPLSISSKNFFFDKHEIGF